MYMCMYKWIYVCIYTCIYMYVYMYIYIYIHVLLYIFYSWICLCTYVCTWILAYMYIHTYTCLHQLYIMVCWMYLPCIVLFGPRVFAGLLQDARANSADGAWFTLAHACKHYPFECGQRSDCCPGGYPYIWYNTYIHIYVYVYIICIYIYLYIYIYYIYICVRPIRAWPLRVSLGP